MLTVKSNISERSRRLFRILAICLVSLIFLSVLGQAIIYGFELWSLYPAMLLFNVDAEFNIPALFSAILLMTCSRQLVLIGRQAKTLGAPYLFWKFLGVVFFYLAFDELFELHERLVVPLRSHFGLGGVFWFAWVIVAIPLVGLLAAASLPFLLALPRRTRNYFVMAGILFVGGALGMEMIGSWYVYHFGDRNFTYNMIATTEETFEMVGAITFLFALLDYRSNLPQDQPSRLEL
jgi:fucose 4-O-acetylase-like acetyltransferase